MWRLVSVAAFAGLCAALVPTLAAAQSSDDDPFADRWLETNSARLEALDKVTGRTTRIETRIAVPVRFGTLDIVVRACHKRPPESPPDSAGFLDVVERRGETDSAQPVFTGWMFAASPGLSTLEHPVYDVIVLECFTAADYDDGDDDDGDDDDGDDEIAIDSQESGEESVASE